MIYIGMIGPFQIILILVFVLLGILPTIIALIDILKSEFNGNNKIVWILVVLLMNFFGAILYFSIGREQKINKLKTNNSYNSLRLDFLPKIPCIFAIFLLRQERILRIFPQQTIAR